MNENMTAIHEFFDELLADAVAYRQFSEAIKAFDQYFITWGSPLRGHLIPMSNFARVVPADLTELYRTDLFPAEAASKLQPGSKFAYRHPNGNPYHAWTTVKKPMLELMKERLAELPASKRSSYVPVFLKCVPPANSVCWHPGMVPALKAAGAYLKTKSASGKKLGTLCSNLADSVIVKEQEFILVPRAFPVKAVLLKSFGKPNLKLEAKQRLTAAEDSAGQAAALLAAMSASHGAELAVTEAKRRGATNNKQLRSVIDESERNVTNARADLNSLVTKMAKDANLDRHKLVVEAEKLLESFKLF